MEKYKFFEHTADAKFQAYGKTLEEAFSNAVLAMFSIMTDTEKVKPVITRKIIAEGKNEKALLYNWLEEFLFLLDSEMFIVNKITKIEIKKVTAIDDDEEEIEIFRLSAVVVGDKSDNDYELKGEVKAVTYNEMDIQKEDSKVMVQVVVDI